MIDDMANLKGVMVLGASWELPCFYGRGQSKSKILSIKNDPTQSATRFAQNYESKWVGASDGALINISKMLKIQDLVNPEMECPKDKKGNFLLNEYVFGIDVARSNSQSNNKSCIVVIKIKRHNSGAISELQLVNIVEPPNGLTFKEQSIVVKRLFYKYGGNMDEKKSRVKMIVIDGNVIGKGLIDRLCEEVTDPDTHEELGCFSSVNSDVHCDDPDAPALIYDLTAQGINGDIITKFTDYVETEKLRLLKPVKDLQGMDKLSDDDKLAFQQASVNTNALIDEVANLRLETNTKSVTVKQIVKKIDKDRYSALVYALYYISVFMERTEEQSIDDENRNYVFY